MRKIHIYLVGVTIFGLFYAPMKAYIANGPVFLFVVIVFAGLLRLLAERLGEP